MVLIILLYSLFASVFTVAKIGLNYTEPLFFVGTRMLIASLCMLSYTALRDYRSLTFRPGSVKRLVALAFFNIYLTNALEFWGLNYLSSFKTCFIYSLSPFIAALLSFLLFEERLTLRKWIGLLIGFIGFIPILLQMESEPSQRSYSGVFTPELAVALAAVASSYGWIIMRQLIRKDGYEPAVANGYSMLLGGFFSLLHSFCVESWRPLPVTNYLAFAQCTLLLVVISNLLAYNLYAKLLKRFTATFLSFAGFICPLAAAFFGWLILGERVGMAFAGCAAIVFIGLLIFYKEELHGTQLFPSI